MQITGGSEMVVNLALTIEDIDSDICEISLIGKNQDNEKEIIWNRLDTEPAGPDYALTITTSYVGEKWHINNIQKGAKILTSEQEIKELFLNALLELSFQRQIDNADGIEHEHDTATTLITQVDKDPYDPKLIRVDTRAFSIHQVNEMIQTGDIDLSPDFQREFVWLDITRKSRLIESLLLRIPLPVFYLAQDEDGKFKVVDGVQRLTVIRDFLSNKFRLRNLEYLKECEGKWFNNPHRDAKESLDQIYVRRIEQTQLYLNIIDPQTPERVKYDIFRRINTGGKSLNAQEIRNCLEKPTTRGFVKELAKSEEFLTATRHSISSTRMADNEIVLRFIAFFLMDHNLYGQSPYKGDMDSYLNNTVELLNKLTPDQFEPISIHFKTAMENAYLLFGAQAFRKASYINKALFLSWSRILCDIPTAELQKYKIGDRLHDALKKEIATNDQYSKALSMATNDVRNVDFSYNIARKLLDGVLNNEGNSSC